MTSHHGQNPLSAGRSIECALPSPPRRPTHTHAHAQIHFVIDFGSGSYWYTLDSIAVHGPSSVSRSVITDPENRVVYAPKKNREGTDTVTFASLDSAFWTVNRFNYEADRTASVSVDVTSVNDAPVGSIKGDVSTHDGELDKNGDAGDGSVDITLNFEDVDSTANLLEFEISSFPKGELTAPNGVKLSSGAPTFILLPTGTATDENREPRSVGSP